MPEKKEAEVGLKIPQFGDLVLPRGVELTKSDQERVEKALKEFFFSSAFEEACEYLTAEHPNVEFRVNWKVLIQEDSDEILFEPSFSMEQWFPDLPLDEIGEVPRETLGKESREQVFLDYFLQEEALKLVSPKLRDLEQEIMSLEQLKIRLLQEISEINFLLNDPSPDLVAEKKGREKIILELRVEKLTVQILKKKKQQKALKSVLDSFNLYFSAELLQLLGLLKNGENEIRYVDLLEGFSTKVSVPHEEVVKEVQMPLEVVEEVSSSVPLLDKAGKPLVIAAAFAAAVGAVLVASLVVDLGEKKEMKDGEGESPEVQLVAPIALTPFMKVLPKIELMYSSLQSAIAQRDYKKIYETVEAYKKLKMRDENRILDHNEMENAIVDFALVLRNEFFILEQSLIKKYDLLNPESIFSPLHKDGVSLNEHLLISLQELSKKQGLVFDYFKYSGIRIKRALSPNDLLRMYRARNINL